MDIGLYVAVLRRHRLALVVGLALAVLLAVVASFRISLSPPKLTFKLLPTYSTTSQILVTQAGAPTSRVNLTPATGPRDQSGQVISPFGDPSRFEYLAQLYAQLANSYVIKEKVLGRDGFQRNNLLVLDGGKVSGSYAAAPFTTDTGSLPLISIVSSSTSEAGANEIAGRATKALQGYLATSQRAAAVPAKNRVQLMVVTPPTLAKHVKSRPVIMPLAVFVLVMVATGLVVFFLENLKRNRAPLAGQETLHEEVPPEIHSVGQQRMEAPAPMRRETRRERAARAVALDGTPHARPRTLGESHSPQGLAEGHTEPSARVAQGGSAAGAEARDRPGA